MRAGAAERYQCTCWQLPRTRLDNPSQRAPRLLTSVHQVCACRAGRHESGSWAPTPGSRTLSRTTCSWSSWSDHEVCAAPPPPCHHPRPQAQPSSAQLCLAEPCHPSQHTHDTSSHTWLHVISRRSQPCACAPQHTPHRPSWTPHPRAAPQRTAVDAYRNSPSVHVLRTAWVL